MGDKTPKAKQRDQNRKNAAKAISKMRKKSAQNEYGCRPTAARPGKK